MLQLFNKFIICIYMEYKITVTLLVENGTGYHCRIYQSCNDVACLGFSVLLPGCSVILTCEITCTMFCGCHMMSRLALSSHAFATVLGIKNAVHRRKLSVKASDLVLFGPPKCML